MTRTQLIQYIRPQLETQMVAPTMPVQDAIELADFLAGAAKDFFRFLPGADIVGGETDVAVVTRHEGSSGSDGSTITRPRSIRWRPTMPSKGRKFRSLKKLRASKSDPSAAAQKSTLPMPKYEYQNPQPGSFVVRYRERIERDQEDKKKPKLALSNFRLRLA